MADENTQTTQNTTATDQSAQVTATTPAAPTEPVAPAEATPAPTTPAPQAQPEAPAQPATETPATPVEPAAPTETVPAQAPAPAEAPKQESSGGLAGLGMGAFKNAVNSAKDAAGAAKGAVGQSQSGMSKLTGTLSSVGGNVVGAVTGTCDCPVVNAADWDKKKVTLHKTFYKTFSTRIFGRHFSDAIDKNRGMIEIKVKDYKVPKNPMILDSNSLLLATLYIEVEGANPQDSKVVSLEKEFYCKVTKNTSRKDLKVDLVALEQEMGKKPSEIYFWFVTCAKCDAQKEAKTVILAA